MDDRERPLFWVGSSKKDLKALPADVQDVFGYALFLAQIGKKHPQAKPLSGFTGAGVLEVVEHEGRNSFRAIYTVTIGDGVYVLHCFQKKSKKGIETPKRDMILISSRLKLAYEQVTETHNEKS